MTNGEAIEKIMRIVRSHLHTPGRFADEFPRVYREEQELRAALEVIGMWVVLERAHHAEPYRERMRRETMEARERELKGGEV